MKAQNISQLLKTRVIFENELESEIDFNTVCACDMMSDLLSIMSCNANIKEHFVLLTGLTNPQVIRTSEMVDIKLIIFVRGKTPSNETVELAKSCGISLMTTPYSLYRSCGVLYRENLEDICHQKDSA
ncbi:MAG TPA: hypothetical protein PLN69_04655 [bacterium]|nr:hypothetical protein [bacterium]